MAGLLCPAPSLLPCTPSLTYCLWTHLQTWSSAHNSLPPGQLLGTPPPRYRGGGSGSDGEGAQGHLELRSALKFFLSLASAEQRGPELQARDLTTSPETQQFSPARSPALPQLGSLEQSRTGETRCGVPGAAGGGPGGRQLPGLADVADVAPACSSLLFPLAVLHISTMLTRTRLDTSTPGLPNVLCVLWLRMCRTAGTLGHHSPTQATGSAL